MKTKIENYINIEFYIDFEREIKNSIIEKVLLERDLVNCVQTIIDNNKIFSEDKSAEIIDVFVSFLKGLE